MTLEEIDNMDQQQARRAVEDILGARWTLSGEALSAPPAFKVYILEDADGRIFAEVKCWRGVPPWCEWVTIGDEGECEGGWAVAMMQASKAILRRAVAGGA